MAGDEIICKEYNLEVLCNLVEDQVALGAFFQENGIEPGSDKALSVEDDLLKVWLKCCDTEMQEEEEEEDVQPVAMAAVAIPWWWTPPPVTTPPPPPIAIGPLLPWILLGGVLVATILNPQSCVDKGTACLMLPRKGRHSCLDCVLHCRRTGSWRSDWCNS